MKATEVTAGLAESNGSLLLGIWRDPLHVTCGLTACTPGSAPGPTLGNEYGKTLPFTFYYSTSKHGGPLPQTDRDALSVEILLAVPQLHAKVVQEIHNKSK